MAGERSGREEGGGSRKEEGGGRWGGNEMNEKPTNQLKFWGLRKGRFLDVGPGGDGGVFLSWGSWG